MKTNILPLIELIKTSLGLHPPLSDLNLATEKSTLILEGLQWINWWYVAVVLEGLVVLFVLVKLIRAQRSYRADQSKYEALFKTVRNDLNMQAVEQNAHQAQKLYRELRRKYHPDKFKDQYKKALAHELIQEISMHRDHHTKLMQLKLKAEQNLGIRP